MNVNPIYTSIGDSLINCLFEVPKYQRGYSWTSEEINDFLSDLDICLLNRLEHASPKEHFFGGVVCVSKTIQGSTSTYAELVDGQQRKPHPTSPSTAPASLQLHSPKFDTNKAQLPIHPDAW